MKIQKTAAALIGMAVLCIQAWAIPGVEPPLPDISGAYVYYRDYSFDYDAYIGFLQYDDTSYAARFYAPAMPLPENPSYALPHEVEFLFTMGANAENGLPEMTGEKIISDITNADTDIINYLHELIYEFGARRSRVPAEEFTQAIDQAFRSSFLKNLKKGAVSVREDFRHFGGMVYVDYDFYVPLFNLRGVRGSDGKPRLELLTAGVLASSSDTSFSDFAGFPASLEDSAHSFTPAKKPKSVEITNSRQTIQLDDQWTQVADRGLWTLADAAILSYSAGQEQPVQDLMGAGVSFPAYMLRSMLLGGSGSYPDWRRTVKTSKNQIAVEALYLISDADSVSHSFKRWNRAGDGVFCLFDLTVYDSVYREHKRYFDNIVKKYRVK